MRLRRPVIGTIVLLIIGLTSCQSCDFRQITEDRPVKLPAESTEPKETHPAATGQRTVSPGTPLENKGR
jgi:hypothetical protein